ncbi:MAG: tetratricopeptide repeat protein [Planctomycetota bacterium]|jgi:tetratricopeptide (TPR) repeat protein
MPQRWLSVVFGAMPLFVAGCQFPHSRGSVPQSLVASRQLCQDGVSALERGRWQESETLLAEAVETCPADLDARRYYAEALWHCGKREQAILQLEEASRLAVDNAGFHALLAEKQLAMGHLDAARQNADSALDLDPKLPAAWAVRARVMRADGRPREALADFHRALGLAPSDQTIPLEIAESYRLTNRPERALATIQNLVDGYSPGEEPQRVLYLQGLAYAALERWDDAAASFSLASKRNRPTPEMLCHLGRAELLAGRPAAAAGAARQALALDPQHQPSRDLLSRSELAFAKAPQRR